MFTCIKAWNVIIPSSVAHWYLWFRDCYSCADKLNLSFDGAETSTMSSFLCRGNFGVSTVSAHILALQ